MNNIQTPGRRSGPIRSLQLWAGKILSPFTGRNLLSVSKHNEILHAVNCFLNPQVNPPSAGSVMITDSGWALTLTASGIGGGGSGISGSIMTIVEVGIADYITCQDSTGAQLQVAKEWWSRPSTNPQTWDGTAYSFVYSDSNHRSASNGISAQDEICYPRYIAGAIIFAIKPTGGTGVSGVDWVEIGNRVWQQVPT